MLRRTLSYEGYRVVCAADGQRALALVEAERPDLILLDWLLPDLDGGDGNVLEVYISYLRQKTEAGGEPRLVQTVRGVGYTMREA